MPTENPVTEKPASTPAPTPAVAETKPEAPKQEGRRFPRARLTDTIKAQEAKPKAEAKPEPEKPAPEPAKPAPAAPEATKPETDTPVTPKPESGSVRASLAKGDEEIPEVKPVPAAEPEPDDEADPTLTDKMRKRVNRLKGETAKEREAREAAEKKVKDLELRIAELDAKPKITEAQQKEQEAKEDELLRLRRRYSLESDPEVKKFDTRLAAATKTIEATVEKADGIPDFVRTMIKDAGGMETFLRSGKLYTVKVEDENKRLTGAQIFKHIVSSMDPLDVGTIQSSIVEQSRIQAEKSAFIEEESGKAKDYFDTQAKQAEEATRQAELAQLKQGQMFAGIGEKIGKEKWMQDEQVPTTGDEHEIKAVKSRNALRRQLHALVEETIAFKPKSTDPEQAFNEVETFYTGIIRDSAKLYYAEHELKSAQARIKHLEAELDTAKGASRTTPRGTNGAAAPVTPGKAKVPARKPGESIPAYSIRLIQEEIAPADRQAALLAAQRG